MGPAASRRKGRTQCAQWQAAVAGRIGLAPVRGSSRRADQLPSGTQQDPVAHSMCTTQQATSKQFSPIPAASPATRKPNLPCTVSTNMPQPYHPALPACVAQARSQATRRPSSPTSQLPTLHGIGSTAIYCQELYCLALLQYQHLVTAQDHRHSHEPTQCSWQGHHQ
jgi:hypothetical protein